MGLRLEGPPLAVNAEPDRLSAPVAPGAIQAAGGQLIILGVAGGTMGGYPHVAHVISADLDRIGQLRPGDPVTFRRVGVAEARDLDRASRQAHRALLLRLESLARDRAGARNGQIKLDRGARYRRLPLPVPPRWGTPSPITSRLPSRLRFLREPGFDEGASNPRVVRCRMIAGRRRTGAVLLCAAVLTVSHGCRRSPFQRLDGPPPAVAAPGGAARTPASPTSAPVGETASTWKVRTGSSHVAGTGTGTRRRIDPTFPLSPIPTDATTLVSAPRIPAPPTAQMPDPIRRSVATAAPAMRDPAVMRTDAQVVKTASSGTASSPGPGVLRGRPGFESDSRGPSVSGSIRDPEDPGRQERDHGPR